MAITKFATYEVSDILEIKGTHSRAHHASLERLADFESYRTDDGYLYVRIRAISSRTNKNHDSWPSAELAGNAALLDHHHSGDGFTVEASQGDTEYGFATFMGKPIFVDHHNSNPKKARGVIVDARLNVLSKDAAHHDSYWGSPNVDSLHLPPTEVELLLEVDAKSFPRLAQSIVSGDLDGFSMGADVDYSKCSHCGHIAHSSDEYCSHILMKGAHHDYKTADGNRVSRRSFEHCYGVKFFEISAVFDPADETAKAREVRSAVHKEAEIIDHPELTDPIRPPEDAVMNEATRLVEEKGVSMDNALDLAERRLQMERGHYPPPGHGEGGSIDDTAPPYGFTPMPQGVRENLPRPFENNPETDWLHGNDPRWSKTAENSLPQSFKTRAPDEIDTLRNEQLCPICGNDMESETCTVCGYVTPPKEFDNPDLDKAKQIRQKMKEEEIQQSTQPSGQPGEQLGQPDPNAQGGGPLTSKMPTKAPATANVTNEMHWTPKVHPKTAARINQNERPVNPSNPNVSDEPKNELVTKDQTKPVTAAMATAQQLMANAKRNHGDSMSTRTADGPTPPGDTSPHTRVDVMGVGGVDQASNEQASNSNSDNGKPAPHAQVDVTGIGETGTADVSPDKTESLPTADRKGDDSGFNTDKTTEDSGPTSTYGDKDGQHPGVTDPVTHEIPSFEEGNRDKATYNAKLHEAYDDKTLEQNEQQGNQPVAQGGSAVQGVQPTDPVATDSYKRVNLLEHQTTPSNNSGPTDTWSGTDGNGVLRQQEPVTKNLPETGGVPTPDVSLHTTGGRVSVSAIRLAEAEVELGLIPAQEKWNRMAEADTLPNDVVKAKLESYAQVKTAGLERLAKQRQSGVTRMPKQFGKRTAAPEGFERIANDHVETQQPVDNTTLDSGLFLK